MKLLDAVDVFMDDARRDGAMREGAVIEVARLGKSFAAEFEEE